MTTFKRHSTYVKTSATCMRAKLLEQSLMQQRIAHGRHYLYQRASIITQIQNKIVYLSNVSLIYACFGLLKFYFSRGCHFLFMGFHLGRGGGMCCIWISREGSEANIFFRFLLTNFGIFWSKIGFCHSLLNLFKGGRGY